MNLVYTYDGLDNVTTFDNTVVPGSNRRMCSTASGTCSGGYDGLNRLVTVIAPSRWGTAVYDYDELGNRNLKSVGSDTTTYAYDPSTNRLTDATGSALPPMTLTWDLANRLATSSDGASYVYDGLGRRVQKTEPAGTTVYHYDLNGRIIAETTPGGAKLRDYVYLAGKLVAVDGCVSAGATICTERQWYHTDPLGSVWARSDAADVYRFDYQAWGEVWSSPAAAEGDRQYNGRVLDPGTGFHDYGARMYWPEIGRFISADTEGPKIDVPQSLNRYSYVWNNPYRYVDPNGKWPVYTHWSINTRALGGGPWAMTWNGPIPQQDFNLLQRAQWIADFGDGAQEAGSSHRHAMAASGQSATLARASYERFIADQFSLALSLEQSGQHEKAIIELGIGAHAIMDSYAPAHSNFRIWDPKNTKAKYLHFVIDVVSDFADLKNQEKAIQAVRGYVLRFYKQSARGTSGQSESK
jgi:RHS repeat-associated protein